MLKSALRYSFHLTFFISVCQGQTLTIDTAFSFGNANDSWLDKLVSDDFGNTYACGTFKGQIDFKPGPQTNYLNAGTGTAAFLMKFDDQDSIKYTKVIGVSGAGNSPFIRIRNISSDWNGNLYVSGEKKGTLDLNPAIGYTPSATSGTYDGFLIKLDSTGNTKWIHEFKGSGDQYVLTCVSDSLYTYSSIYFSGETILPNAVGSYDTITGSGTCILKLDSLGVPIWQKEFPSSDYNVLGRVVLNKNSVIVGGAYIGNISFPFLSNQIVIASNPVDKTDIIICNLDKQTGSISWYKNFVGPGNDYLTNLMVDNDDNLISSGNFQGSSIDFTPSLAGGTLSSPPSGANFILKLNNIGNYLYSKLLPGAYFPSYDQSDLIGNDYLFFGTLYSSIVYNGTTINKLEPNNNAESMVLRISKSGDFVSAVQFKSTLESRGADVSVKKDGSVYLSGVFKGTTNLGSQTFSSTGSAFSTYLVRYKECFAKNDTVLITACDSFVTDSGNVIYADTSYITQIQRPDGCDTTRYTTIHIESPKDTSWIMACNSYMDAQGNTYYSDTSFTTVIPNPTGCDTTKFSIINIQGFNDFVNYQGGVLTAADSGSNYQWYDCTNDSLISGATNQTFTPLYNGSYAVILSKGLCTDTSSCFAVTDVVSNPETALSGQIRLFPNPAKSSFSVMAQGVQVEEILLYDIRGKLIMKSNKALNISIGHLKSGIYLVEISTSAGVVSKKILKE